VGTPRINHNTLVSLAQIDADLAEVRERGYAVDRQESEEDLTCFGSAVAGPDGSPLFALSVSFVTFRVDQEDFGAAGSAVREAAIELRTRLGLDQVIPV
jgi:DNA-binding IclR family transcriptional regulator